MTMIRLREYADSDLMVIEPGERLTIDNAHELMALVRSTTSPAALSMIVDLGRTNFIDSTGIGVLVNVQKHVQRMSGRFAIASPTPEVQRTFQLMNLHHVFDLFESVELAGNHLNTITTPRAGS